MYPVIEVKNLSKSFPDFELKNIDFSLDKGYIMGLIGPNGSGKTTTLKLILDLLKRDDGAIQIFGLDPIVNPIDVRNRIGIVYDECPFFGNLTLANNAKAVSGFYKNWDQVQFLQYLDKFGLDPKKKLSKLSKGMKTKFSLAVALSHHPELLIMDEPTAGLDPVFRHELLNLLQTIIDDREMSIIFSTHITSDLDKVADFVTFIHDGELIFNQSMSDIKASYKLIKGPKMDVKTLDHDGLIAIHEHKYGFTALTKSVDTVSHQLNDSCIVENANLEDIMVFYSMRG